MPEPKDSKLNILYSITLLCYTMSHMDMDVRIALTTAYQEHPNTLRQFSSHNNLACVTQILKLKHSHFYCFDWIKA